VGSRWVSRRTGRGAVGRHPNPSPGVDWGPSRSMLYLLHARSGTPHRPRNQEGIGLAEERVRSTAPPITCFPAAPRPGEAGDNGCSANWAFVLSMLHLI
jgi:hypothetical protein